MISQNEHWLGLTDAVVVITGATGGIGRAIATSFLEAGARVALLDLDGAACHALAQELDEGGRRATGVACDISEETDVNDAALQVLNRLGPADVLVNNAGILHSGAATEVGLAEWNRLIGVNLTGFMLCAKAFGDQMKETGRGAIVNTASIGGVVPQAYGGAYSVTKAGVRMLSQVLAVELGEFGIRSNVVSPAMVLTPLSEAFYRDPALKAQRENMVPSGRIGAPQDIADAVIWLASPRSSYVNGEEILVDGGLTKNLLTFIPRPGFDREAATAPK
jgi:glucose 1-dehydrogenase